MLVSSRLINPIVSVFHLLGLLEFLFILLSPHILSAVLYIELLGEVQTFFHFYHVCLSYNRFPLTYPVIIHMADRMKPPEKYVTFENKRQQQSEPLMIVVVYFLLQIRPKPFKSAAKFPYRLHSLSKQSVAQIETNYPLPHYQGRV